jgi:hypothetical protein
MLAALHSDIKFPKYGLVHLSGKPNSKKGRTAKVKDGIISETPFLGTISVDRYKYFLYLWQVVF